MNKKIVELTEDEIQKCKEFSEQCTQNQQKIKFNGRWISKWKIAEITRDNMIGKIAEVAFSKMMEQYGISLDLDFNINPDCMWSEKDITINNWRIDVNGSREGAKWFLMDWNKLVSNQNDNNLPHAYVMFTVGWDKKMDRPTRLVTFEGVASLSKLRPECEKTMVLRKGDFLPGTNTELRTDNFGIRFNDLLKDVDVFVDYITKNTPPKGLVENFKNPYQNVNRRK